MSLTYFVKSVPVLKGAFVADLAAETSRPTVIAMRLNRCRGLQLKGIDAPRENSPNTRIPKPQLAWLWQQSSDGRIQRGYHARKRSASPVSEPALKCSSEHLSGSRCIGRSLFGSFARSVCTADTMPAANPASRSRGRRRCGRLFTSTGSAANQ